MPTAHTAVLGGGGVLLPQLGKCLQTRLVVNLGVLLAGAGAGTLLTSHRAQQHSAPSTEAACPQLCGVQAETPRLLRGDGLASSTLASQKDTVIVFGAQRKPPSETLDLNLFICKVNVFM